MNDDEKELELRLRALVQITTEELTEWANVNRMISEWIERGRELQKLSLDISNRCRKRKNEIQGRIIELLEDSGDADEADWWKYGRDDTDSNVGDM